MKFVDRHKGNRNKVSIIGQESKPDTWNLCKMNLSIRGIAHDLGETSASTFTNDQFKNRKVDYILANSPFNLKDWRNEDELTDDPRFEGYPILPIANANYAWILHIISKLYVNDGRAGFLLANGALNASGAEYEIQKEILEEDKDYVEAIIVLPRDMFYTTDISVTLWILNMNKKARELNGRKLRNHQKEVLVIDLRTWNENIVVIEIDKRKRKVIFTDEHIDRVKSIYNAWQEVDGDYQDVPELCKSVSLKGKGGLRDKGYSLAPSKYIEFIDHDLDIDYEKEMAIIKEEMRDVLKKEKQSQAMLEDAFRGIGYELD